MLVQNYVYFCVSLPWFSFLFLFIFQNISDEKFEQLFAALPDNTHLETLSLSNTGLTDRIAVKLADALEKNNTLKVVKYVLFFITWNDIIGL